MDGYSGKRLRLAASCKLQATSDKRQAKTGWKLEAGSWKLEAGSQEFAFVVAERARPYRLLRGRP
ncbi:MULTISPECIES: hypothetical protein [Halopseudomonas]|uniref:hypothetical protein n=1 Tax=Halopseudomonas TaxID=2901189 RepID=UPI0022B6336E|nr:MULTISPECIES: hypothetical protein [Halopseudomonas]